MLRPLRDQVAVKSLVCDGCSDLVDEGFARVRIALHQAANFSLIRARRRLGLCFLFLNCSRDVPRYLAIILSANLSMIGCCCAGANARTPLATNMRVSKLTSP